MLSVVGNESPSPGKDLILPPVNLRALRNRFFKCFIQSDQDLRGEDLSALLLYIALSFLENKRGLARLFKTVASNGKRFEEFTENEMLILGNEFLELLARFLPSNLRDIMVAPNKVSWQNAKRFFTAPSKSELFADIANLGFAYQIFSSSGKKKKALSALQTANKKVSKEELIAFTQLYTPNWVVDFLVANTILAGNEDEKVTDRYLRWLIPNQNAIAKKSIVELKDYSLLDPACGAGQFLFSAFDLLMQLYEQSGYKKYVAAKLILEKNIFAADIDEQALWVAGLGLLSKYLVASESIESIPGRLNNLVWVSANDIEERTDESNFLGSIDARLPDKHILKNHFSVLLTNPPYIGRRCLSRELKAVLKAQYPNSSSDLSAAFLERCLRMLKPQGRLGLITQSSVMSIPSYKLLREYLLNEFYLQAAINCGPGVFPLASGEKIDSILLLVHGRDIQSQESTSLKTCLVNLNSEKDKATKLHRVLNRHIINNDYQNANGDEVKFFEQSQFVYGMPDSLLSQLTPDFYAKISKLPRLGDIADVRQGLATTDNGRFVRYRFDLDEEAIGDIWVPYIKGAGAERFAINNQFMVKWGKNGEEIKDAVAKAYPYLKGKTAWVVKNEDFYFRPGLCFSFINKSGLAVRRLPAGAIFDVASSAIFALPEDEDFLLAYLNSRVIGVLAKAINQTINIQVGDVKKIPVIPLNRDLKNELSKLGHLAFEAKNALLEGVLPLLESQSASLSAADLSAILEAYIKMQARLTEELCSLQIAIDTKVTDAMVRNGLIDPIERQAFDRKLILSEAKLISEKQYVYKLLLALVSNIISTEKADRLVLIPSFGKESLSRSLHLQSDSLAWFEDKLGNSLEKIFSQAKVTDISKLAQEPSRYFSFYLKDYHACLLFSSSAVRHFKKSMSTANIFIPEGSRANLDLLEEVNKLWHSILAELDHIVDWTSKDLLAAFESNKMAEVTH